jgi:beta-1,4-mannosyl-glycoprotein beta-1,4-N-acetylglucosaminyltransferase
MEMLLSEVICIYYPLAGLVNTLGDYGIPVERDAEIDTIMNLTNKRKNEIRKRGKEYAISCSWENRAKEWMKIMDNDNNINIEKSKSTILDMWKNYNVEPYYNFPVSKYWFGYSELKNYLLNNIDLTKQYNILEIGSFEGCSSCFISDIVINNALSTLTCVDPFVSDGSIETDHSTLKYKFYSNIKKTQNYNKINVVEKFSDDFYSTYNGSNFNFIYIDGEHSEKQILKDLDECFSLLDINGMIWCDDYNNKWKDIFDNWILLKNDFINVIHSGYQIAFIKKKNEVKIKGEKNIANEWSELPFLQNLSKIEKRMFDLYETISMPEAHTNILKKISETFTPNVIYDIGASTLHWTKAAKNIWPNTEFFAFDAIEEAEKLYKSKNIKYNIGVISDQDNKIVKFYENKENPAGNSYYKEIGHPNSVNVYPENSYIERKAMTLETVVKHNSFLLPDLVKIDVQGAELDILNGGMNIINNAKYLIIELQNVEYNRGAPLENITIDFLNKNGWEIVEAKFSDNGPDADYLFINKNYNFFDNENNSETQPLSIEKECSLENQVIELNETTENIWVFYPGTYFFKSVIQYIENLSDNSKKTIISNDVNYINSIKTDKIIFLLNPFNIELFERDNIDKFYNKNFSFLQLEPLTLPCHLNNIISYFNTYPYLKEYPIYDYSKTNIRILNKHGITNCIHLPYNCIQSELDFLIQANTNKKEYDFGFVYDWVAHNNGLKSFPIKPPRRNKIMSFLLENGFTINLIRGYGEDRDIEFGKCKIILNPHGQINEKQNPLPDECSNIFEHIRCDRLLKADYTILSETSYDLDQDFIDKYPNLKIIKYEDFFNLEVINKIIYELNIKNIYDKTELQEYRYDTHNKDKADSEYQFKMCTPIQNQPSKKIIDCFTFYNELELLKYRLTILNDYVDYFVLVEATHTFVGKEKPLYYQENKELFKEFNHKIVHIVVDDFSHKYPNINIENREQWNNEIFQRNCIKRGLDKLKLNDEDIFTVTDLDEIADPKILEKIKKNEINIDAVIIELDFYYYNLNCKMKHPWHLSKMISYKKYKELDFSCEQIRQMPLFEIIPNAGWHLSYFGDEKFIKNKIENFGHQEYNIEDFTNENNILNRIKNQKDLYNRSDSIVNVEIEDNDNLPPKYDIYLKNFYTNNIQNIKSNLIKYSNLRDDICRFENYDD